MLHDRLASSLRTLPWLDFALLFGSQAEGTSTVHSDVDVAVWIGKQDYGEDDLLAITCLIEKAAAPKRADLTILNSAGTILRFEALQGVLLFVREDAEEDWAGFYSHTCREYEDLMAWRQKQLQYRGYEPSSR